MEVGNGESKETQRHKIATKQNEKIDGYISWSRKRLSSFYVS